jgi:hypothetical protein
VAFYEDFPYVARAGALDERLEELGGREQFLPVVSSIDSALPRKIGAIETYHSQIGSLFADPPGVAEAVAAYAAQVRPETGLYGERLWVRR